MLGVLSTKHMQICKNYILKQNIIFCGRVYNTVSNEVPYGGWLMTESRRIWKKAAMA
jgi:hypothetical protein